MCRQQQSASCVHDRALHIALNVPKCVVHFMISKRQPAPVLGARLAPAS